MKKGKHLVSLILAAAMAAGLTACGGQTAPQTTAAASEGTKQAEAAAPAESQEKEEASAGKAEVTLSLNHVGATTHPYQYGSERFAELVSEKTGGRIAVEVYPASQIASGAKAIEFVQMGTLDIALESTMAAENFIPEIGVLNLPFLFENADQAFSVLDGDVGNELSAAADAKGSKILCWMYNGFRDISNSVKPITAPEDLKGLKIRVPESQVFLKTFETLGGVPTPMAISEVFTAMQLKTVDGQENPSAIFVNNKYNEVNDYYSVTHHISSLFFPSAISLPAASSALRPVRFVFSFFRTSSEVSKYPFITAPPAIHPVVRGNPLRCQSRPRSPSMSSLINIIQKQTNRKPQDIQIVRSSNREVMKLPSAAPIPKTRITP